ETERLPFARLQAQLRQLADLPFEALAFERHLAPAALCGIELAREPAPRSEGVGDRARRLREPRVAVEQLALPVGTQQRLRRVLAVDVDQPLADLAQCRRRGRVAVDQRARAAVGLDHAAQQHAAVVALQRALGQPGVEFGVAAELGRDVGARATL